MIIPLLILIMLTTAACSNETNSCGTFHARYGIDKLIRRDTDYSFTCEKWPSKECPTAVKSASFALSLLREASSHSESFVLSPYSIGLSLAILHDGANGKTQEELGKLLMKDCASSDVSEHYSGIVAAISEEIKKRTAEIAEYNSRMEVPKSEEIKNESANGEDKDEDEYWAPAMSPEESTNETVNGEINDEYVSTNSEEMMHDIANGEANDESEDWPPAKSPEIKESTIETANGESNNEYVPTNSEEINNELANGEANDESEDTAKSQEIKESTIEIANGESNNEYDPTNSEEMMHDIANGEANDESEDWAPSKSQEIEESTNETVNGETDDEDDVWQTFAIERFDRFNEHPNETPVVSATRFYVNESTTLKPSYSDHILKNYEAEVEQVDFSDKAEAARKMNEFVDVSSKGAIKDLVKEGDISIDTVAMLINVITFRGRWELPFNEQHNQELPFRGSRGLRNMTFMTLNYHRGYLPVNIDNDFGTAVLLKFEEPHYKFFMLMPKEHMDLETMRNDLTGEKLMEILTNAKSTLVSRSKVPKFEMENDFDVASILAKLGASTIFRNEADLSKMTEQPIKLGKSAQLAAIKIDEDGTAASASTRFLVIPCSGLIMSEIAISFTFDRPFLYGIMRDNDILFLGQLV